MGNDCPSKGQLDEFTISGNQSGKSWNRSPKKNIVILRLLTSKRTRPRRAWYVLPLVPHMKVLFLFPLRMSSHLFFIFYFILFYFIFSISPLAHKGILLSRLPFSSRGALWKHMSLAKILLYLGQNEPINFLGRPNNFRSTETFWWWRKCFDQLKAKSNRETCTPALLENFSDKTDKQLII